MTATLSCDETEAPACAHLDRPRLDGPRSDQLPGDRSPMTVRAAPRREPPFDDECSEPPDRRLSLVATGSGAATALRPSPRQRRPGSAAIARGRRPGPPIGASCPIRRPGLDEFSSPCSKPAPGCGRSVNWPATSARRPCRGRDQLGRLPTGASRHQQVSLNSVHVCEPADGVAEVCAVVFTGARYRAIAARLEGLDGHWRCVGCRSADAIRRAKSVADAHCQLRRRSACQPRRRRALFERLPRLPRFGFGRGRPAAWPRRPPLGASAVRTSGPACPVSASCRPAAVARPPCLGRAPWPRSAGSPDRRGRSCACCAAASIASSSAGAAARRRRRPRPDAMPLTAGRGRRLDHAVGALDLRPRGGTASRPTAPGSRPSSR